MDGEIERALRGVWNSVPSILDSWRCSICTRFWLCISSRVRIGIDCRCAHTHTQSLQSHFLKCIFLCSFSSLPPSIPFYGSPKSLGHCCNQPCTRRSKLLVPKFPTQIHLPLPPPPNSPSPPFSFSSPPPPSPLLFLFVVHFFRRR